MCNRQCLNPFDPEQQKGTYVCTYGYEHFISSCLQCIMIAAHRRECLEKHEREMERAFQVQGYILLSVCVCELIVELEIYIATCF